MEAYSALTDVIRHAERMVFFGGAGVSTESDIPDFRGGDGLFFGESGEEVRPETLLHHDYFVRHPDRFYRYYRSHMLYPDARPNAAHIALAEWESMGKLSAVITQNIDGLHTAAGSRQVIELHGSTRRNHCVRCGRTYGVETVLTSEDTVPHCPACGGMIRPDIVMYGEALDDRAFSRAEEVIADADVLIVGGTSLLVQPAASLLFNYRGKHLVIINQSRTPYDDWAEIILRDPIGQVLGTVAKQLR